MLTKAFLRRVSKIIQSNITQAHNLKARFETITYFTKIKLNYLKYTNKKIFNQYTFAEMTFDNHNLERLKELGRKLPKEISTSQPNESIIPKNRKKHQLHPVEVETNPEKLFRELIEISPDGNIPPHLLERLKDIESNHNKLSSSKDQNMKKDYQDISIEDSQKLYTQFKQFLLED